MTTGWTRREIFSVTVMLALAATDARPQSSRRVKVGFIRGASYPVWGQGFVARLAELGFVEGRNLELLVHETPERPAEIEGVIHSLIDQKVDVLVTTGTTSTLAAKRATQTIPIVFLSVSDPVRAGVVSNLARPEANVTGISNAQADVIGKRLGLLRELIPGLRSIGVLTNINNQAGMSEYRELTKLCVPLNIAVEHSGVGTGPEFDKAIKTLAGTVQALYVFGDYLTVTHRERISKLAMENRIPTMYPFKEFVIDGGLLSYGPNVTAVFRRAADYTVRILSGVSTFDLPVEQPTTFELVANARTAQALALKFPNSVLLAVDTLIE